MENLGEHGEAELESHQREYRDLIKILVDSEKNQALFGHIPNEITKMSKQVTEGDVGLLKQFMLKGDLKGAFGFVLDRIDK